MLTVHDRFTGRYHTMVIMLNRPSPQIPKPTPLAASKCFDSAAYIINLSSQQMKKGAVDITWVFILGLYMAVNTLLWTVSYDEIRERHPKEEMEELVNNSLDIIDHATERWPGTAAASQLYAVFAKACLQSYDSKEQPVPVFPHVYPTQSGAFDSPLPGLTDANSPPDNRDHSMSGTSNPHHQFPPNPVQFGYVFGPPVEEPVMHKAGPPPPQAALSYPSRDQPKFRQSSIFYGPSTSGLSDRRPSYFPPDYPMPPPLPAQYQQGGAPPHLSQSDSPENIESPYVDEMTPPATHTPGRVYDSASPPDLKDIPPQQPLPTPPETAFSGSGSAPPPSAMSTPSAISSSGFSPSSSRGAVQSALATPTPSLAHVSPSATAATTPVAVPQMLPALPVGKLEPLSPPRQQVPVFTGPHMQQQQQHFQQQPQQRGRQPSVAQQQRPLPAATTVTNWFNPPPPFMSDSTFGPSSSRGPGPEPPANSNNNGIRKPATHYVFPTSNPAPAQPPPPPPQQPGFGRNHYHLNGSGGLIDTMLPTSGFGGFGGSIGGSGTGMVMAPLPDGFERHGSLSAEQQLEMMDVLEAEGMGDIDNFLAGLSAFGQQPAGGVGQQQVGVGVGDGLRWGT